MLSVDRIRATGQSGAPARCAAERPSYFPASLSSAPGYLSPQYADSLSEFGTPRQLPLCGGWIVIRPVPESSLLDAMGCYPLFGCTDWSKLKLDLDTLSNGLVSLTLVTDPFGTWTREQLAQSFDLVRPFKQHFVSDLRQPASSMVSKHHQRDARRALKEVKVERCEPALDFLEEWIALYRYLQARHNFRGIQAFSRSAFEKQLAAPGLVMFRACVQGEVVGVQLWYVHGDVAYYHLGAANAEGYRLGAFYAMLWHGQEYFRRHVRWLDLGAVPGLNDDSSSGLRQFKSGWATATRPAFLCGKILQPENYERLSVDRGAVGAGYFPSYRVGEHAMNTHPNPREGA